MSGDPTQRPLTGHAPSAEAVKRQATKRRDEISALEVVLSDLMERGRGGAQTLECLHPDMLQHIMQLKGWAPLNPEELTSLLRDMVGDEQLPALLKHMFGDGGKRQMLDRRRGPEHHASEAAAAAAASAAIQARMQEQQAMHTYAAVEQLMDLGSAGTPTDAAGADSLRAVIGAPAGRTHTSGPPPTATSTADLTASLVPAPPLRTASLPASSVEDMAGLLAPPPPPPPPPDTPLQPYLYQSRHDQAQRCVGGPGGRFLSAQEKAALQAEEVAGAADGEATEDERPRAVMAGMRPGAAGAGPALGGSAVIMSGGEEERQGGKAGAGGPKQRSGQP